MASNPQRIAPAWFERAAVGFFDWLDRRASSTARKWSIATGRSISPACVKRMALAIFYFGVLVLLVVLGLNQDSDSSSTPRRERAHREVNSRDAAATEAADWDTDDSTEDWGPTFEDDAAQFLAENGYSYDG
jgi:hypothetical protein